MKRIFCFLAVILTVSLLLCLPLSALAAEQETEALPNEEPIGESYAGTDAEGSEPADQTGGVTDGKTEEDEPDTVTDSGTESVFSLIYNYVIKHSPTILSALSFLSAISVVITLKRALMPSIKELFGKLKRESDGAKESSKEQADMLLGACDGVRSEAQKLNLAVEESMRLSEEVRAALCDISYAKQETGELKSVLLAELEMLYEVFMAASLPQYEKERVGERFMSMRAAISKGEKSDA